MKLSVRLVTSALALVFLTCGAVFAQTDPSLTLDPTSGPPTATVMADVSNFSEASCAVHLFWDSTEGTPIANVDLSAGASSTEFGVPTDATVGEHTVIAVGIDPEGESCETPSGEQATAMFTVGPMEPSMTLDPTSAPPRATVSAEGDGFDADSCGVQLYLDATDGTLLGKADLQAGAFSTQFLVPTDSTIGEHTVIAVGLDLDGGPCETPSGQQASAILTIEEPAAMLMLDPNSGPARSIVIVSGELFDADSCGVDLYLDSTSGSSLGSAELTDGEFSREIEIPDGTTEGDHEIIALGLDLMEEACTMMTGQEAQATYGVLAADPGPFVSDAVMPFVQEMDLGDLPKATAWQVGDPVLLGPGGETGDTGELPGEEGPTTTSQQERAVHSPWLNTNERKRSGLPALERPDRRGPLRQMLRAAMMTRGKGEPRLNFDGIPATGVIPPSSGGDVGIKHFIQTVNAAFAIYDKQGNVLAGPLDLGALWTGTGAECEMMNDGDPDVRYDAMADRWIISSIVADNIQCLAISRGNDPVAGGWYLYQFATGDATIDYPRLAVWPDAYLVGTQRSYPTGGSDAWAFDRAAMLDGKPAISIRFNDPGWFMLPADLDGEMEPAKSAPGIFLRIVDGAQIGGDDRLEMVEFLANFTTPTDSAFTAIPDVMPDAFDRDLCGFALNTPCVEQPDGAPALDAFTALAMARLQYRAFDDHEGLVFNHTVDADGDDHAGVRWYELRRSGDEWSVHQQGTHAPDVDEPGLDDDPQRWMAGAAMDKNQNLALGYNVASDTVNPGIRYGGRYADDPLNSTPRDEESLIDGGGSQTHPGGSWGEFSSMTVDPIDDCTFWYTSEYYAEESEAGWRTRIGTFQLDNVPPSITCPADSSAECSATGGSPAADPQLNDFFDGVSATDDCTLDPRIDNDAPFFFLLGLTEVEFGAIDSELNASSCSASVEIVDTTMPSVLAPDDIVDFECTSPDGTSPDLGMPTVDDVCDAAPVVMNDAPPTFPLGSTTVTWSATDQSSNVGMDTQTVEIVDTIDPELTLSVSPASLWPPNHKMIDVEVSVEADDICDATLDIVLLSIHSDESANGNGDGNTQPDIAGAEFGTDDRQFQLRAERKGNGDGRVYTIVYGATDDSGNQTLAAITVTVSHDQGKKD